jgi:hypothetical protein
MRPSLYLIPAICFCISVGLLAVAACVWLFGDPDLQRQWWIPLVIAVVFGILGAWLSLTIREDQPTEGKPDPDNRC